jgi:SAM-dependent methyltransferase
MTDLSAHFPLLVDDEFELVARLVPLRDREVLDIGCGAAQLTRRMAIEGAARRVVGIEVDQVQIRKNLTRTWPDAVAFEQGGAEALPFEDQVFDGVALFKSLHHVPVAAMDGAFGEMHRVLRPEGWIVVSEPVYRGAFNDVMRLFHDEGAVRASAQQAVERALASGLFRLERRVDFLTPIGFSDFDDFRQRMMNPSHSRIAQDARLIEEVRAAYGAHQTPHGARFIRPMRIDLLRKA